MQQAVDECSAGTCPTSLGVPVPKVWKLTHFLPLLPTILKLHYRTCICRIGIGESKTDAASLRMNILLRYVALCIILPSVSQFLSNGWSKNLNCGRIHRQVVVSEASRCPSQCFEHGSCNEQLGRCVWGRAWPHGDAGAHSGCAPLPCLPTSRCDCIKGWLGSQCEQRHRDDELKNLSRRYNYVSALCQVHEALTSLDESQRVGLRCDSWFWRALF